jgi:hypothetical protein
MNNADLNTIAFYAFRYALGRMTYAVDDVVTILISLKDELNGRTKHKICDEIKEAIKTNRAGHKCDQEDWKRLMKEFEA